MYCVKCGVSLEKGTEKCPLCGTPVWNPDGDVKEKSYPDTYPKVKNPAVAAAAVLTVICVFTCYLIGVICSNLYGRLAWGSYAVFGILLAYVWIVLPLWFKNPNPVIFIAADHVAAALYLLFVNVKTGGNWFLSFGFPVVMLSLVWLETAVVLYRYVRGGKFFITGGLIILIGGFLLLLELFQHITFGTRMFSWSGYAAVPCAALGLFCILAGIIRPLREFILKHFFV